MALLILQGLIAFLLTILGVELPFHPPEKKWQKWCWRLAFGLSGLLLMGLTVKQGFDQSQKDSALEHYTQGAPFPAIGVELYSITTNGMKRTMDVLPVYPGFVVVSVEDTNDYPVYDLSVTMTDETPLKGGGTFSQTMNKFNESFTNMSICLPNRAYYFMLPGNTNSTSADYEFYTQTRSGRTSHRFIYMVISNRWEHSNTVIDLISSKVISRDVSKNFRPPK